MLKKLLCIFLSLCFCLSFTGCGTETVGGVYDRKGNLVVNTATIDGRSNTNLAYIDVALVEAVNIISNVSSCTVEEAKNELENYNIYTYLEPDLSQHIANAYISTVSGSNFGCAITDLNGKLLSVFSASKDDTSQNFVLAKKQQHSTMKPLSVYAPAIEKGLINWTTLTEDSPYKVMTNSKGVKYDWPSNASGKYSYENITTYTAIKQSINTVAVKILSQYGVNNSISFLQDNLGLDLSAEQYRSTIYGEDEVIGNVALGATQAGSTPIEMAGYYQIFANGGKYTAPTAIKKITDKRGKTIYEDTLKATQVISPETSYIMNELMRGVAKAGGTGEEAFVEGVQTAGKTGTGSGFTDNWFVGVTPEYSCAVWHSHLGYTNSAAKVFSNIFEYVDHDIELFMTSPNVKKYIYCLDSGLLLSNGCKKAEMGYFLKDAVPNKCNMH